MKNPWEKICVKQIREKFRETFRVRFTVFRQPFVCFPRAEKSFCYVRDFICRPLLRFLPYWGTLLFLVLLSAAVMRHEMWRDEIQAWLLARGAATPWDLLVNMKYEGHPGLWHLLIWIPARLWADPAGMQICHILIASASVFLLLRFAPFPCVVRILTACGYYFCYEWAVIARNYAISALLLFAVCVLYRERWRFFPYIGGVFFLLCHTNIGSILFTIVMFVLLMIDFAVAYAGHFRGAERYFARCFLGFLLIAAGIATGILQIRPPEDSGYAVNWRFEWKYEPFRRSTETLLNAFLPLPPDRKHFWNSNSVFLSAPKKNSSAATVSGTAVAEAGAVSRFFSHFHLERSQAPGAAGILLAALFLVFFFKRPWMGLQFFFCTVALVLFFYVKYGGSWRHHGMIYLAFLASFWMSYYYDPWRLPWRVPEKILDAADRFRWVWLLPLLCIQIRGAQIALKNDWNHPFSMAKECAAWVKETYSGEERAEMIFIGRSGPMSSTLCGFLGGIPFYYTERGEFGTYMIWDKARFRSAKKDFFDSVREISEEKNSRPCLLILGKALKEGKIPQECRFLRSFSGGIVGDEQYHLYLWTPKKKTDG